MNLWFTIAGSHTSRTDAYLAGAAALQQPDQLLRGKLAEREALMVRSRAEIPNAMLQAAFDWAN